MGLKMPASGPQWWEVSALVRNEDPVVRSVRASAQLLQLAAGLGPADHLSLVLSGDGNGQVSIRLHAVTNFPHLLRELEWATDRVAEWRLGEGSGVIADPQGMGALYEVVPTVTSPLEQVLKVQDPLAPTADPKDPLSRDLWPIAYLDDGLTILTALSTVEAQVRVHMAPVSDLERQMITELTRRAVQSADPVEYDRYISDPVQIRCFVGQSGTFLSPRLRAAMNRMGLGLRLQQLDSTRPAERAAWRGELSTLRSSVLPFGAAQCLVHLPACGPLAEPIGVPTKVGEIPPVPLDAESPAGLRVGVAETAARSRRDVRLGPGDLLLHTQVLGATGTGKSTLLAGLVGEAVAAGLGVTVLDPHGHLVDRVAAELPAQAVTKAILVDSGDTEHPIPMNVSGNRDQDLIDEVMTEVLRDLLDPRDQGFMGPVFERVQALLMQAQRVLYGSRANLATVPHLIRKQEQVGRLALALPPTERALKQHLMTELARRRPEDFAELATWFTSKYQRLLATAELRGILATGEDAVDVTSVMDHQEILLVQLASPSIGPLGAQLLGEMWLAKHWAALSQRADVTTPHLLVIDEAHLFASGLLPRLLSQARKFGIAVVLAHQNLEQLTPALREAALATTSNVLVFRAGPQEEFAALRRLGDWAGGPLTRLRRFQATTLSQNDRQSDAFTLITDHNERIAQRKLDLSMADAVRLQTWEQYSDPHRGAEPLSAEVIDKRIERLIAEREEH